MLRIEDDGSKKTQSYSEETTLTLINVKHLTNGSVVFFFLTAFLWVPEGKEQPFVLQKAASEL